MASLGGFFVLLLGAYWLISSLHEANRRKSFRKLLDIEEWDLTVTAFLKIFTGLGFLIGILSIISGAAGLILDEAPSIAYASQTAANRNLFTSIFLIVLGILTFLRPLNDIPIASILGLLVGSAITILTVVFVPDAAVEVIANFVNPKIFLIVLFIIIFIVVALTVKFYTAGIMFFSKLVAWPPIAMILSLFCFVQGFMLLALGISLF